MIWPWRKQRPDPQLDALTRELRALNTRLAHVAYPEPVAARVMMLGTYTGPDLNPLDTPGAFACWQGKLEPGQRETWWLRTHRVIRLHCWIVAWGDGVGIERVQLGDRMLGLPVHPMANPGPVARLDSPAWHPGVDLQVRIVREPVRD